MWSVMHVSLKVINERKNFNQNLLWLKIIEIHLCIGKYYGMYKAIVQYDVGSPANRLLS